MSDIFYSQVDSNLWNELNARGQSGRYNRDTKNLDFMLGKIANVALIPYNLDKKNPDNKYPISEAILGGNTVRGGEYLPGGINGFLADRKYDVSTYGFNEQGKQVLQKTKEERVNSSRRIPPFITSMDLTIGDHSMGLLNSVTMNITIPNPERDLNYIESVYLRPGRHVTVIIEHPESAVLTFDNTLGKLSDTTLPSLKQLAKQQGVSVETLTKNLQRFRKMNSVCFDGLIQNFTIDYQTDMSVTVTLNIIGTSNVYTDVSLIINSQEVNKDPESPSAETVAFTSFFDNLTKEVDAQILATKLVAGTDGMVFAFRSDGELHYGINGKPRPGIADQKYIQLTWLVSYINRVILTKIKNTVPQSKVIFSATSDLSISNYYPGLCSCNPDRIFFSNTSNRKYLSPGQPYEQPVLDATGSAVIDAATGRPKTTTVNPPLDGWYIYEKTGQEGFDYLNFDSITATYNRKAGVLLQPDLPTWIFSTNTKNPVTGTFKNYYKPTGIFINMKVIQDIVTTLTTNQTLTVSALLEAVSKEVYDASGYAISLKLITHPEDQTSLLWYDCNAVASLNSVKPYPVPMFSNHPAGTIIRDFKFSGQLPQDASNLSYVLNSDPSEISESNIAPFVSFMYTANTVTRTGANESISSVITDEEFAEIKKQYQAAYEKFQRAYYGARTQLGLNYLSSENQSAMFSALQKYIQYPSPDIQLSSEIAAPTIPFEVEFTIDGINGFRYGDVLTFDGLPDRYKKNAVFCVISVTHTVGTDGQWTTTVRCIMRPKID